MIHNEPKKKRKKRRSGVHVVKIYERFSETTPLSGLNWRKGMVSATSLRALLRPLKGMSCWSLGESWLSRRWSIILSWCSMLFCFSCKADMICCVSIGRMVAGWVCRCSSGKRDLKIPKLHPMLLIEVFNLRICSRIWLKKQTQRITTMTRTV